MTLVVNEMHLLDGLSKTLVVAAADRRISLDGEYADSRRKVLGIPYLHGAVSYFGLAKVYPPGREQWLDDWLSVFINSHSAVTDLGAFACELGRELGRVIPQSVLKRNASGFHICGYNQRGLPDFWYLSNIGCMDQFVYRDLSQRYDVPASHFLGRDAPANFGWDGVDPSTARDGHQTYRNGDIRGHEALWDALGRGLTALFHLDDFQGPGDPRQYGEYVKFKFEVIAYVYRKWAKKKIIDKPIDVLVAHNLNGSPESFWVARRRS